MGSAKPLAIAPTPHINAEPDNTTPPKPTLAERGFFFVVSNSFLPNTPPIPNTSMQAVLFDLDGTLHDRALGLYNFARDQFSRIGRHPRDSDQYTERFLELDACGRVWKDEVYSQLIQEFQLHSLQSPAELVQDYLSRYPDFAIPMPGTHNTLLQIRELGLKIGIITNGRTDLQYAVIDSLAITSLVDVVVVSEQVGLRKPDRQIFDFALGRLGVTSHNVIMVGDDPVADIGGAHNAGIRSIFFGNSRSANAVYQAQSMKAVLDAVASAFRLSLG